MRTITVETAVSGIQYPVTLQQFESVEEVEAHYTKLGENPADSILKVVNTYQEQQAKQGGKEGPRKLLRAGSAPDSEEVMTAIAAHQTHASEFVIGVPRAAVGGVTQAKRKDLGTAIVEFTMEHGSAPSTDQLTEIASGLGITL